MEALGQEGIKLIRDSSMVIGTLMNLTSYSAGVEEENKMELSYATRTRLCVKECLLSFKKFPTA